MAPDGRRTHPPELSSRPTTENTIGTLTSDDTTTASSSSVSIAPDPAHPYDLLSNSAVPAAAKPFLVVYIKLMNKVWYARGEPTEEEFEQCMKVVALIIGM
jgi:hypothetical protein